MKVFSDGGVREEQPLPEPQDRDEAARQYQLAKMDRLSQVLSEAFAGRLSRNRSLKYWENLKLRPQHLQILLMKCAGFNNKAISRETGIVEARISVIINHPDSQKLMSIIISHAADDVLDMQARIQAHAHEALDTVVDVMRNTKDDQVKANTGFKLLSMAGYGSIEKKQIEYKTEISKKEAQGLQEALREAEEVEEADYEIVEDPAPSETPVSPADEAEQARKVG